MKKINKAIIAAVTGIVATSHGYGQPTKAEAAVMYRDTTAVNNIPGNTNSGAKPTPTYGSKPTPTYGAKPTPTYAAKPTPDYGSKPTVTPGAKVSPKVSPKVTPKVSPKVTPKVSPKVSPKATPTPGPKSGSVVSDIFSGIGHFFSGFFGK